MAGHLLAIDNVILVQILESQQNISSVESRILQFESLAVAYVEVQLSTMAVVQDKVQAL